ncbi:hypothetical protein J421_5075 (plasmid) [Gemmatirosa kalamazoonensis]|uniref:Uncharacterized protein n=1 Tax=Gemmatirosa kalamazoonensis TaxID=861299 RepID=W0RQI7_9BACT|nr:hypothetical protein [Gemmatirosa kalamazoonensis]AHG92610.1 hypothetical protein J421_5075 [Gemmatirosa kalamazoonensis]
MREATIHCSVRDMDVRALLTDEPLHDGQASLHDAELICLDLGEGCEGRCPLGAEAPTVMDALQAKAGLVPERHATVRGLCDGCDRRTELRVVGRGYLTCTECGATGPLHAMVH